MLCAAALALFPPDARAQASGVALHAGWGAVDNQPTEQLAEGRSAFLTVRATGLSGAAPLKVRIEANRSTDAAFISPVFLTAAAHSTRVRVTVIEDGLPELRETVEFQVSVLDNASASCSRRRPGARFQGH